MIENILLNGLIILSIWFVLKPSQVFGWGGQLLDKIPFNIIKKPLFQCLPCMSSFWGITFLISQSEPPSMLWVYHILALCGLMVIVSRALDLMSEALVYLRMED